MAKKTTPKKAAPKKASKVASSKKAETKKIPSNIDNRLSPSQKKDRDNMLKDLKKSSDVDVLHAVTIYHDAPEWTKENMRIHYEKNGGTYINAIFNGNLKVAKEAAPEKDKKLF